jgi:hypothetical protein
MTDESEPSGRAKGGVAAAKTMTPEQLKERAKKAAEARWGRQVVNATHGAPDHPLVIGDIRIQCYVLENGTRVLAQRSLQGGIGMSLSGATDGAQRLAVLFDSLAEKGIDCKDLAARIRDPILFRPTRGGRTAYGYEATILADICDKILEARNKKALQPQQDHFAQHCEVLVRGFARVGIIALVDEVTGYQEVRDKLALQEILELYLRKEAAAWVKRFPDEFYKQLYRLREWEWHGMAGNRISACANYTKDLIYDRIEAGLLRELENRNPSDGHGNRRHRHHQLFTDDVGIPKLAQHFGSVMTLQKISKTWDEFYQRMQEIHPRRGDTLQIPFTDEPSSEPRQPA